MVAILEMVNIAKALTHGGCGFCEVSSQKVQPSQRKVKIKNFAHFCSYHGNGSHVGKGKYCLSTYTLWSWFL
jgi:radical SAM superfamily enzyme